MDTVVQKPVRLAGLWWSVWPVIGGLAVLLAFYKVGDRFFDGYLLDLGSVAVPAPAYTRFAVAWCAFGLVAAGLLAVGFARLAWRSGNAATLCEWWESSSDGAWILFGALGGLLVPLALRRFVLQDAPLTDDESAYRFMAELLASGRLWAQSPPLKLFFDRIFMINDGRLYPQYFIGWPALMAPGVWLGNTGVMNAIYSALTVPALFLVARRLAGRVWAKVAVPLYLSSPMLMVGAATELTHTSCLMALAWMTWFFLRSRDEDAPWWSHSGIAFFFGLAFFIRPPAAVGIGLPVLIWWTLSCRGFRGRCLAKRIGAFALPAVVLGGLFLGVNKLQNGSITTTGYQRVVSYLNENGFRFSGWDNEAEAELALLKFDWSLMTVPLQAGFALFRLNFDLFGWPCSFLFALLAGFRRQASLPWTLFASFFLLQLLMVPFDAGIDSFGPMHYFEAAWPILLLTVLGLKAAVQTSELRQSERASDRVPRIFLPPAALAALVLLGFAGFTPIRCGALARMADNINMPLEAVAQAGLHNAVIFARRPFAPNCRSAPTTHFVFWHPTNDPDLRNDVLWVNHISVEQDRRLITYFPGRRGYVMLWKLPCNVVLLPLDSLRPDSIPDGEIGGTGEGPS